MIGKNFGKFWRSLILTSAICLTGAARSHSRQTTAAVTEGCPNNLEDLTTLLLADLPNYANRVIQRTQDTNRTASIDNYIVSAGKANFKPLNLPRIQYDPIDSQSPEQVFFTVLERQYHNKEVKEIQTYHWLFLTPSDSGWRLVMLFSRFGDGTEDNPPTPPLETSNGIIGQGIQLWLRDCRARRISGKTMYHLSFYPYAFTYSRIT